MRQQCRWEPRLNADTSQIQPSASRGRRRSSSWRWWHHSSLHRRPPLRRRSCVVFKFDVMGVLRLASAQYARSMSCASLRRRQDAQRPRTLCRYAPQHCKAPAQLRMHAAVLPPGWPPPMGGGPPPIGGGMPGCRSSPSTSQHANTHLWQAGPAHQRAMQACRQDLPVVLLGAVALWHISK